MRHPKLTEDLLDDVTEDSWNKIHYRWDQWDTAPLHEKRYHTEVVEAHLSKGFYKKDREKLRDEQRQARKDRWEDWKFRTFHPVFLDFLDSITRR